MVNPVSNFNHTPVSFSETGSRGVGSGCAGFVGGASGSVWGIGISVSGAPVLPSKECCDAKGTADPAPGGCSRDEVVES